MTDHMKEAREWLASAKSAVEDLDYDDPYPNEFIQTAALMAIAHALVGRQTAAEDLVADRLDAVALLFRANGAFPTAAQGSGGLPRRDSEECDVSEPTYERPERYWLPYLGEMDRQAIDEIRAAIRDQDAAHRRAWEQERRAAGQVWVAEYYRYHVDYTEEFFSLAEAQAFLVDGEDMGQMSAVGVRLPDGDLLRYSFDWVGSY